jgi:hypothetical protein
MPIDVFIVGESQNKLPGEPTASLDDDAYYWFFEPEFQSLAKATGPYIDLYGEAVFPASSLLSLQRSLVHLGKQTSEQPNSWKVTTGFIADSREPIRKIARRDKCLLLLDELDRVVLRALQLKKAVAFIGD